MLVKCILEIMLALILTLLGIFIVLDSVTMAPPQTSNYLDHTTSLGSGRYNVNRGKKPATVFDEASHRHGANRTRNNDFFEDLFSYIRASREKYGFQAKQ